MTTKENLKLQIEWFNYFADFIKTYDINLYNDSCAHADNIERQILEDEFIQFPELDEFISCRECTEEAEPDSYFCSDSCAEDHKNNYRFDREKEEN